MYHLFERGGRLRAGVLAVLILKLLLIVLIASAVFVTVFDIPYSSLYSGTRVFEYIELVCALTALAVVYRWFPIGIPRLFILDSCFLLVVLMFIVIGVFSHMEIYPDDGAVDYILFIGILDLIIAGMLPPSLYFIVKKIVITK